MKYNIIGDIHGRAAWRDLVADDGVNIFLGDYFSPYEDMKFSDVRQNFEDILEFKRKRPETVLIVGNHDENHWHCIDPTVSRHDGGHLGEIRALFEANRELFVAAYNIDDVAVASHAGVSVAWYMRYKLGRRIYFYALKKTPEGKDIEATSVAEAWDKLVDMSRDGHQPNGEQHPKLEKDVIAQWRGRHYTWNGDRFKELTFTAAEVADFVNGQWKRSWSIPADYTPGSRDMERLLKGFGTSANLDWDPATCNAFDFYANCGIGDAAGFSVTQSPMWIRPISLEEANIFRGTGILQFVGHTQREDVFAAGNIVYCDCLGFAKQCAVVEDDNVRVRRAGAEQLPRHNADRGDEANGTGVDAGARSPDRT